MIKHEYLKCSTGVVYFYDVFHTKVEMIGEKKRGLPSEKLVRAQFTGNKPSCWKHFFTVLTLYSGGYRAVFSPYQTPYSTRPFSNKYRIHPSIASVNKSPTRRPKVRPSKYHPIPNRMIKM